MSVIRQVTILGNDADGFTWQCGHCGTSGLEPLPSRDQALAAFDTHYATSSIPPCEPWVAELLTAGQQLAGAADAAAAAKWQQALEAVPAEVLASWRSPGDLHPVD